MRRHFFLCVCAVWCFFLAGQELNPPALFPTVKTLFDRHFAASAPAADGGGAIEEKAQKFSAAVADLQTAAEKCQALTVLAQLEESNFLYALAAEHYSQAALLEVAPERALAVKVSAARSYVMAGDSTLGAYILNTVISKTANARLKKKAEVYMLFAALNNAEKYAQTVTTLKAYSADVSYDEYRPALYFALYWLTGDEKTKAALVKSFPSSLEAAVVQNKATISPVAFWYLMPRAPTPPVPETAEPARSPKTTASNTSAPSVPIAYQVGYFTVQSYAEHLAEALKAKGFAAFVKTQNKNGAAAFSVLVKAAPGDTGLVIKLKEAGYECYPVFE